MNSLIERLEDGDFSNIQEVIDALRKYRAVFEAAKSYHVDDCPCDMCKAIAEVEDE